MDIKQVTEEVLVSVTVTLEAREVEALAIACRMAAPLMMEKHPEGFWLETGWSQGATTLEEFADAIERIEDEEEG